MKRDVDICGKCFDRGAKVHQQCYPVLTPAINVFSSMHQQKLEPAMCQHHDGSYRVCHEIRQTAQPLPAARSSWLEALFGLGRRPELQRA